MLWGKGQKELYTDTAFYFVPTLKQLCIHTGLNTYGNILYIMWVMVSTLQIKLQISNEGCYSQICDAGLEFNHHYKLMFILISRQVGR